MVVSGTVEKKANKIYERTPSVELIDFSPDKDYAALPRVPDLPYEMLDAVSAFLDGKAIICGGHKMGPKENDCFTYYPKVNRWRKSVSMDFTR